MADETSKTSKVLIFTAPNLCIDCIQRGSKDKSKESQVNTGSSWRTSTLTLSGNSFVVCDQQGCNSSRDVELTDESDIRLEYDPLAVQESVCFYLDSEFRNSYNSSMPSQSSFGFETEFHITDNFRNKDDLQREFEDIRSASQKLLVENSAGRSSISSGDDNIRGVKRKAEEFLNVDHANTHQLTMEDIYTQDKCPSTSSDSCSPANKEARIKSSMLMTSCGSSDVSPTSLDSARKLRTCDFMIPKVSEKLTLLKECTKENSIVNMLFTIIQVNDIRDVQVKSGVSAGSFVALSSLVVADESKSCLKLTLWREASRWTEKITPGDFAVATAIKIGKWRDEYVGQTTFNSGFYNLHQPKASLSNNCLNLVSQARLHSLVMWVRSEHPYLLAVSHTKKNVEFTEIPQLRDNTLVHYRGKLISIHSTSSSTSTYRFGGQQLTKISAVLTECPRDIIELFLWGRQAAWLNQLQEGLGQVWEFQFLTAKYNSDNGCMSLHSTPRSTKSKLRPEDKNAQCIMSRFHEGDKVAKKFANIRDLLESKYAGLAEVKARISSVQFNCQDEVITVDENGSTRDQLKENLHKLVYIGCGSCMRVLPQDQNGIYGQCSHCVVTNSHYKYTIGHYYKPLTVCLCDSHVSVEVEAFTSVTSRLFGNFPAKTLLQRTANASSRDQSYVDSFIEHFGALVKGTVCKAVVACCIEFDENSFIENRTFTLRQINIL